MRAVRALETAGILPGIDADEETIAATFIVGAIPRIDTVSIADTRRWSPHLHVPGFGKAACGAIP